MGDYDIKGDYSSDWNSMAPSAGNQPAFIVYNGDDKLENTEFSLLNWRNLNKIVTAAGLKIQEGVQ